MIPGTDPISSISQERPRPLNPGRTEWHPLVANLLRRRPPEHPSRQERSASRELYSTIRKPSWHGHTIRGKWHPQRCCKSNLESLSLRYGLGVVTRFIRLFSKDRLGIVPEESSEYLTNPFLGNVDDEHLRIPDRHGPLRISAFRHEAGAGQSSAPVDFRMSRSSGGR